MILRISCKKFIITSNVEFTKKKLLIKKECKPPWWFSWFGIQLLHYRDFGFDFRKNIRFLENYK